VKLAALFWFYGHLDVCENRLRLLRALNPGLPIYGLYGGEGEGEAEARRRLEPLMEDFYAFAEARDGQWKWRHGDRLIAAWMRERGACLDWETVVVVQWDLLILEPLRTLFGGLKPAQALFSGDRPASEVRAWWGWLKGDDPDKRAELESFRAWLRSQDADPEALWCCLFIVAALPREYLVRYAASGPPEPGFLEYKMPTLARRFGTEVVSNPALDPWWAANPATKAVPKHLRTLNAVGQDVTPGTVLRHLRRRGGRRLFHPYRARFPVWLARLAVAWSRP
jgi:hypothetical protein